MVTIRCGSCQFLMQFPSIREGQYIVCPICGFGGEVRS